ncbi:MAG: LamG domain-containing protein [Planctomycetaceae bacterium]
MRNSISTAAVLASVMLISVEARGTTIFGANYDNSKSAGIAAGNPVPVVSGDTFSVINTTSSKFGAGSLDTTGVFQGGNGLKYDTASNFNPLAGTIDFWMQMPNPYNNVRQDLFSIFAGGYTGDFGLYINDNGDRLTLFVDVNGVQQWVQHSQGGLANAVLSDGNWHHIAWEWDTVAEISSLYVDGVAEAFSLAEPQHSVSFAGGTLGTDMEIGSRQGGYDAFQGNIDDLRIFDTAIYNQVPSFTPPTSSTIPDFELPGDFDGDGDVDGNDFLTWQRTDGTPSGLTLWQENYGTGVALSAVAASASVPEPSTWTALLIGTMTLGVRRSRCGLRGCRKRRQSE